MDKRLTIWLNEIRRYNRILHLVGTSMLAELEEQVEACCELAGSIDETGIADLGSGSGLPGIPLAVCCPAMRVTLIERSAKKCQFLRHVSDILGLKNLEIAQHDALTGGIGPFEALITRAFSPRETLESIVRTLLVPQGQFYLMGTRSDLELSDPDFSRLTETSCRCRQTTLHLVKFRFTPP